MCHEMCRWNHQPIELAIYIVKLIFFILMWATYITQTGMIKKGTDGVFMLP